MRYDESRDKVTQKELKKSRGSYNKFSEMTKALWEKVGGNSSQLETIANEIQLKTLRELPTVNDRTVTLGELSAISAIANPLEVATILDHATDDWYINPVFNFYPPADRGSSSYPGYFIAVTSSRIGLKLEFMHYGSELELRIYSTSSKIRMLVDGEYTNDSYLDVPPNNGGSYRYYIDFGTTKERKISFEGDGMQVRSITISGNDSIYPPYENKLKCIAYGDSVFEGTGSVVSAANSTSAIFCKMLGWGLINNSLGGTGYIATASTGTFLDRAYDEIINIDCKYLVVRGGLNDTAHTAEEFKQSCEEFYDYIIANRPDIFIIPISPYAPNEGATILYEFAEQLRVVALERSLPYIDNINGKTYSYDGTVISNHESSWITGTGSTANPQTAGNATIFTGDDGTHPTKSGHQYDGERIATEIIKVLHNM